MRKADRRRHGSILPHRARCNSDCPRRTGYPAGESRFKYDGGHGGHNGLRDIPALGGHRDFWRLRIGIGHPGSAESVWLGTQYASAPDQVAIEASTESAITALPLLLDGEDGAGMTALHSESHAATPSQED